MVIPASRPGVEVDFRFFAFELAELCLTERCSEGPIFKRILQASRVLILMLVLYPVITGLHVLHVALDGCQPWHHSSAIR